MIDLFKHPEISHSTTSLSLSLLQEMRRLLLWCTLPKELATCSFLKDLYDRAIVHVFCQSNGYTMLMLFLNKHPLYLFAFSRRHSLSSSSSRDINHDTWERRNHVFSPCCRTAEGTAMRVPSLLLILTLCSATASESRASPSELDEVTTNSLEDQLAQDRQGWMDAWFNANCWFKILLIQLGIPA